MIGSAPAFIGSSERHIRTLFPDASLGAIVNAVTDAIYQSFKTAGLRSGEVTMNEKRRRFKICMDWAITLRADFKWGVQRIGDAMPEILKTELSGTNYVPSQRQCWIPQDGR